VEIYHPQEMIILHTDTPTPGVRLITTISNSKSDFKYKKKHSQHYHHHHHLIHPRTA